MIVQEKKFEDKWKDINAKKSNDEFSLFVKKGDLPKTQRQINLFWYHRFIQNLIKDKNYKNGLEMGCGRGTMSLYLNLYDGLKVSLLDIAPEAVELAKKNFENFGAQGNFVIAPSNATGLLAESYDIIYSVGLLEHLSEYKKTTEETYRLLRKGGVMVHLNIPGKWSVQNINNYYKKLLKIFTGKDYPVKDYWRNIDKPGDYAAAAKDAGFKDIKTINVCLFPIFVPIADKTDLSIAKIYNAIIKVRSLFMEYPFRTNYWFSQGHFLIGYKL